ncbi:DUF4861 family protein [Breznakibacter xylanolyticus]|nr:DUF4861 family protein [Breznakibacter xylanolyticus]
MKLSKLIPLAGLLTACSTSPILTITNPGEQPLQDMSVTVPRTTITNKLPKLSNSQLILAITDTGDTIPCQFDDMNGDEEWDEMVLLMNLPAKANTHVQLKAIDENQRPKFPTRTNYRFGSQQPPYRDIVGEKRLKSNDSPTISEIYQMEGPAWENDLVGFRNYYDARNGIDIFGKKTNEMALDSAGIRTQNYHEMDNWGMDILKVANSLGAGAIAIATGDTMYRVGPCLEGDVNLITQGPVRTILEFTFKGIPTADSITYDVRHRISIYAGEHFYRSQTWLLNPRGNEKIVTGIVHKHDLALMSDEHGLYKIFGTHGAQAYKGENLGLGLLTPKASFNKNYTSRMTGDGITETYLVEINTTNNNPAEHYFFSGWSYQDEQFNNPEYFMTQMKAAANKLSTIITVQ